MHEQMIHHHYPLQAHLYLVALHRHLQWRLPGYDPTRHLGGYAYIFLRGMPGSTDQPSERSGLDGLWNQHRCNGFCPSISC